MQMIWNPHISGEVWATDWINKRKIYPDEYAFWHGYLGQNPTSISVEWFDTIPFA